LARLAYQRAADDEKPGEKKALTAPAPSVSSKNAASAGKFGRELRPR
jgi:hypothetical protein